MNLKKILRYVGELKVYCTRIWGYVSILQFLMIFIVFLSTTVYAGWVEKMFPDKQMFLLGGILLCIMFSFLLGYIDKHVGIHAAEISQQLTLQRNPTMAYEVSKVAYVVSQAKKENPNSPDVKWMEEWELYNFERLGMGDYFKRCLSAFMGEKK